MPFILNTLAVWCWWPYCNLWRGECFCN